MKATFTTSYSNYYPCDYVKLLLGELDYQLPFHAGRTLRKYSSALVGVDSPRIAFIGSGYGIEAAVFRHDVSLQTVLNRWGAEDSALRPFEENKIDCRMSLFDIEDNPLKFALDSGLAHRTFRTDLTQPFSAETQQELSTRTDIVTVFGAISYIESNGFRSLVDAAFQKGNAKLLAYSILKYQDHEPYLEILKTAGLSVRKVGTNLKQRNYKTTQEKEKVTEALRQQNKISSQDDSELHFDLYIAYVAPPLFDAEDCNAKSLIILDSESFLPLGSTKNYATKKLEELPHPWHLALSSEQLQDPKLSHLLSGWHTRNLLTPSDTISSPNGIHGSQTSRFEHTFAGEYSSASTSSSRPPVRSIKRVIPEATANFEQSLPSDLKSLEQHLSERGHLIVRGDGVTASTEQLNDLLQSAGIMDYNTYGTQRRTQIKKSKLQNVTPWPEDVMILPHNEMTYHLSFPEIIAFTCIEPTQFGGETTIYDCSWATEKLSDSFRSKASEQDLIVQRRYSETSRSMGHASWKQAAGENANSTDAEAHFSALGFTSYIKEENTPEGLEPVVFTELKRPLLYDCYGHSCLHATIAGISPYWYKSLAPDRTPPYAVFWEDGSRMSDEEFAEIEAAVLNSRIHYSGWQANDIMILSNPMIAHGRLPLIGKRLIGYSVARPAIFEKKSKSWRVEYRVHSDVSRAT